MYLTLDKHNFKSEVSDFSGKVLVDFWAPWCGPCQMLSPLIEDLAHDLGETVKVAKVNVDDNPELAAQFAISSIPAVLIFDSGLLKNTLIGFHQKQDYLDALK